MSWLPRQMRWLMWLSGALTCTMLYFAVAPEAAQQSNFGAALSGPVADVVVRSWGVLVALVGGMLIYGALTPAHRTPMVVVAAVSKLTFVLLVLTYGRELLAYQVRTAVIVDSFWVVVFFAYLIGPKGDAGSYFNR